MTERTLIQLRVLGGQLDALQALLRSSASRGYRLESVFEHRVEISVPLEDAQWRKELTAAAAAGLIADDWRAAWIRQDYTAEEVATAKLFTMVHVGRVLRIPTGSDNKTGLCHITVTRTDTACGLCGAGASQNGPLRMPAGELNKAGTFASITLGATSLFMIAESARKHIESAVGGALPCVAVEAAGATPVKERWWQLWPTHVMALEAVREHRYQRVSCSKCGAVRLAHPTSPFGAYFTIEKGSPTALNLPTLVLRPFWEGDLLRFADGRVRQIPQRRIWVRGDVARVLRVMKVRGLELQPIIER